MFVTPSLLSLCQKIIFFYFFFEIGLTSLPPFWTMSLNILFFFGGVPLNILFWFTENEPQLLLFHINKQSGKVLFESFENRRLQLLHERLRLCILAKINSLMAGIRTGPNSQTVNSFCYYCWFHLDQRILGKDLAWIQLTTTTVMWLL